MFSDILRHGKRFLLSFPVKVRIQAPSSRNVSPPENSAQEESTVTENISSSGCYFHLSEAVPVGTEVELELTIPGGTSGEADKVFCRGVVVRVDKPPNNGPAGVATTIDSYHFGNTSEDARSRKAAYVQ